MKKTRIIATITKPIATATIEAMAFPRKRPRKPREMEICFRVKGRLVIERYQVE